MLLYLVGEMTGNFFALSYTSAAVVAPLGAIAILVSGILAKKLLHENISNLNQRGYVFLISGVICILFVAPRSSPTFTASDLLEQFNGFTFRLYFSILSLIGLYTIWNLRIEKHQRIYKYILIASILGSITIASAKAISVLLRLSLTGESQFENFLPYSILCILVLSALGQEYYKQQAIGKYDASKFWPMFFASYNLFAVTLTVMLFPGESQGMASFLIFYPIGVALIFKGSLDAQKKESKSLIVDSTTSDFTASIKSIFSKMHNVLPQFAHHKEHERP